MTPCSRRVRCRKYMHVRAYAMQGGKPKAEAAAAALKTIFPGVVCA
jgi:hypothetical protein